VGHSFQYGENIMKILLEYDQTTGGIYDARGMCCGTLMGATGFDTGCQRFTANELVGLKNAGFTAEEIFLLQGTKGGEHDRANES
jgi:hypothetical protein